MAMLVLATTRDITHVPVAQRVRAGLAHGSLAFGETRHLTVQEPLIHTLDQRLPLAYINTTQQQEPWWQPALDAYWCQCAAGSFWVGNDQSQLYQMRLDYDFAMGRYPVTNAEYARFIAAGGYTTERWWTPHGWVFLQPGEHPYDDEPGHRITKPRFWNDPRFNAPTQPVVGISWYEAMAYCAWVSELLGILIRLPTALEYERAARHTDQRPYPWGDPLPIAEYANYARTGIGAPTPIGCFPLGHAVGSIADMVGNVNEWLATKMDTPLAVSAQIDIARNEGVLLSYSDFTDGVDALYCGSHFSGDTNFRYIFNGFRMLAPHQVQDNEEG